jgi:hypothetical protein
MKPSEVEPGFYYAKKGSIPDWLRFVLFVDGGDVVYVDFTNFGRCSTETFGRWAARRHTALEAAERFPKEVVNIDKIRNSGRVHLDGLLRGLDWDGEKLIPRLL